MAESHAEPESASRSVAAVRLAVGLAQGVALYLLNEAGLGHHWPATVAWLNAALLLVFVYAPLIPIGGLGRIRALPLALWTAVAAALLALFAWQDITAGWDNPDTAHNVADFPVWALAAVFVFVGHHLVGPADEARRPLAPYPLYFDWAWKDGVQLALSLAFLGVFWGALKLGGALFGLIGIDSLNRLIQKDWFFLPVSGVVFAGAVQLTDVRVGLIRGVRTVALVLLSWLLPVLTAIVVAFLLALQFTGLGKLFGATSGASTVLAASAGLIVLLSAAYQDGAAHVPFVLRWAGRAAGVALVPLALIAGDALWLRIAEHGFTPARVLACAAAVVAAGFAIGYAIAAVRPRGPWMKPLELTNVLMARVVMLVIVLLLTPIADPARLSVDNQVDRLMAGRTAPAEFDFQFLRFRAGHYGMAALQRLAKLGGPPRNAAIAVLAHQTLIAETPGLPPPGPAVPRFQVYPAGTVLPPTFVNQAWNGPVYAPSDELPPIEGVVHDELPCFGNPPTATCEAEVADIDGDGKAEVLVSAAPPFPMPVLTAHVYKQHGTEWEDVGVLVVRCDDAIAALRAGKLALGRAGAPQVTLAGQPQQLILAGAPCPPPPPPPSSR